MNQIARFFSLLINNPALLAAKLRRRLFSKTFRGGRTGIIPLGGVQFAYDLDLDPLIREMVTGNSSEDLIHLMRRYLRSGDVFIDVGANIGYVSAQGLSLVGKTGQVHSFEPVPAYFARLEHLKNLNPDHCLVVNNCALGQAKGSASIALSKPGNIGWNTIVPNFIEPADVLKTIDVPVERLDEYLHEKGIDDVKLIKIDTEGYEFPVLLGLSKYLATCKRKPWIVCEVAKDAFPKLGYQIKDLEDYMLGHGYRFLHTDTLIEVCLADLPRTMDVFFVPIDREIAA